jgi:hypothetical protein
MEVSSDFLFSMGLVLLLVSLLTAIHVFQAPPSKRPEDTAAE